LSFARLPAACSPQTVDKIDAPATTRQRWQLAAGEAVDDATLAELAFAWRAVRAGEIQRDPARTETAGHGRLRHGVRSTGSTRPGWRFPGPVTGRAGSVAASDAFFPFADGLQVLLDAGVRAVVEPGGSVRDEEVIAAAKDAGRRHSISPAPVISSTDPCAPARIVGEDFADARWDRP